MAIERIEYIDLDKLISKTDLPSVNEEGWLAELEIASSKVDSSIKDYALGGDVSVTELMFDIQSLKKELKLANIFRKTALSAYKEIINIQI